MVLRAAMTFDRRLKRTISLLTTGALVTLIALRVFDLWALRRRTLEAGERRAANLALISATHLRAAFAAADATMRQLAVYSRQVGGPAAPADHWEPMLVPSLSQLNGLGSISIVDAEGIIRHSTIRELVGQSRRDNSLFKQAAAEARDELLADTPFQAVMAPGRMLIPLGRRLTDASGGFAGSVVATFTSRALRDYYERIDVGPKGEIWVFHPEGFVMIHVPAADESLGEKAAGNPLFERARTLVGPGTARLTTRGGAPAIAAFQPVSEPALFAVVALDESELLANWRHEAAVSAAVLGVVALGFAAVLRLVYRELDARAAAEDALARTQRLDAIGQLTGGVAHDFNNLLTAIMLNVSLLKGGDSAAAQGEAGATQLDEIEKASRRAAQLVQQMLTFARRQPLRPQLVDLNDLVGGLQSMLTRMLGEDITLKIALAAEPCPAEVDSVQLQSALVNLCLNSRDAMPRGGALTIATALVTLDKAGAQLTPDASPGRYVELSASDTGTGIAPEVLPRIFEPFFTTKPVGQGTGLGLSMVYGFLRQSGGHVKVETEAGRGTQIKLYFPLAARAPAKPAATAAPAAGATGMPRAQPGEIILFLEDESTVRRVGQKMLENLGYRVVAVTYGGEALARARDMPRIDLLLADVVLPGGLNGREVAEELTRQRPGLPVLFASGYAKDILQDRGQLGPVLRLLTKPYTIEQLSRAVRAAIDGTPHPIPEEPAG